MKKLNTKIRAIAASMVCLAAAALAQDQTSSVPHGVQFKASEQAEARGYWTRFRLENAKPMSLPRIDPGVAEANEPASNRNAPQRAPRILAGARPTISTAQAPTQKQSDDRLKMQDHAQPDAATTSTFGYVFPFNNHQVPDVNMYPYSAVGKLFFTVPDGASVPAGEYVCSGAVFYDSHTVITARHCMYDYPTGKFFSNFVFYPGYDNGPNPAFNNGWTVRGLWTWGTNSATRDFDVGFLQLNDAAGYGCDGSSGTAPIWTYTGSLGVWIFDDVSQYATIQADVLAYPQAAPFSGDSMYQDSAVVSVTNPFGTTNVVELGNPQTGGSAGGPWIVGLNPNVADNGTNNTLNLSNIMVGLNAFHWTSPSQPLAMNGPAFLTYNVWNLYVSYTQNLACR